MYEARPDVPTAFNRGWQTTRALRLAGVDVTSRYDTPASPRELLRRSLTGGTRDPAARPRGRAVEFSLQNLER